MIFRRKRFPLPKFPPSIRPSFRALCQEMESQVVNTKLRELVSTALKELQEKSVSNDFIDLRLAESLALKSFELIDRYDELSSDHKRIVVGAIRYFADSDDAISEDGFATGLDDDAKIMNHVLEEIGETEGFIAYKR